MHEKKWQFKKMYLNKINIYTTKGDASVCLCVCKI